MLGARGARPGFFIPWRAIFDPARLLIRKPFQKQQTGNQ
jgi:hypothetical protein